MKYSTDPHPHLSAALLVFVISFICIVPFVLFCRYLWRRYDRRNMPIQTMLMSAYTASRSSLTGFAGAYEYDAGEIYSVKFSINGNGFERDISSELYHSSGPIRITYIVGKSGKVYIRKIE